MSNKKIGFYFEDQLPNISTPLLDDFSFFYVKNEKSFNNEIVNIPKLFLYIKNINNFLNLSGPDNYYVNSVNNIISNNGNIDLNLQNIVDKDNSLNKEIKFINGNYLYSKDDVSYFSNLSDTQINNFNNISNTILIGKNFGDINYELISNNNIFLGNNIKLPNNNISNNLILTNDLNISLNNYQINNNTFIGGYFYSENTEEFINQQIISGNIFIKGLGFGNISENFKFNLPLSLSNNTKIIDIDNNNENDSLLYENILVSKNNGLIGIKRINSFDFVPTLSQVLVKSGSPNTINIENINLENLKFNNFVNNESISLDNKIGYLIIDNTGKILWKELENKPTLESVILENPIANTKPIFNEVEISNKLYVKNLTNKNNDILFDKLLIANSNGELAQISKNDLLSEKQNVLDYNPENSANKSDSYTVSSSTTYASTKALVDGLGTKLDKGGYVGTAQDLYDRFEGKIEAGYNCIPKVGNGASGKVLVDSVVSEINGKIGIGLPSEASEKLEVNGNVKADNLKAKSTQFQLQSSINPTPNTLVPKTDGSGLIWYNNNSVPTSLGNIKEIGLISEVNSYLRPYTFRLIRNHSIEHSSINDTSNPIKLKTNGDGDDYYTFTPFEFFTLYNVVITIEWFSRLIKKDGTIVQYDGTPNYKLWLPAGSLIKVFAGFIKIL